jgi:hypothetical protein
MKITVLGAAALAAAVLVIVYVLRMRTVAQPGSAR